MWDVNNQIKQVIILVLSYFPMKDNTVALIRKCVIWFVCKQLDISLQAAINYHQLVTTVTIMSTDAFPWGSNVCL